MVRPPVAEPVAVAEPLAAGPVAAAPLTAVAEPVTRPAGGGSRAPIGGMGLWLAWVASVGAVLLALAGLWLFRTELSLAWPPIQRLYGLLA